MTKWWSLLGAHCCCLLLLLLFLSPLVVCDRLNIHRADNRRELSPSSRPSSIVSDVSIPSIVASSRSNNNGPLSQGIYNGERRRNSKQMLSPWLERSDGDEASSGMPAAAEVRSDINGNNQWVSRGGSARILPASQLQSGKSMSRYSISPATCKGTNGTTGVCMFNFQCTQFNGTILGTCVENFLFGACCGGVDVPDGQHAAVLHAQPPAAAPSSVTSSDDDKHQSASPSIDTAESLVTVDNDAEALQNNLDPKPMEASASEGVTRPSVSDDDLFSMVSKIVDMSSNHSTDRPLPNYFHVKPILAPQNSVLYGEFYLDKPQKQDIDTPSAAAVNNSIDTDVIEDTTSPAGDISLFSGKNETHDELQSFWSQFFQKQNLIPTSDFKNFDNLTVVDDVTDVSNSTTVTPSVETTTTVTPRVETTTTIKPVESKTEQTISTVTKKPSTNSETSEGRSTSDMTSSTKMLTSPMTPTPATSEKLTSTLQSTTLQWTTRRPPYVSVTSPYPWPSSTTSVTKVTKRPSSTAGTTFHLMKTTNLLATTPRPFNSAVTNDGQKQETKTPAWLATMTTTSTPSMSSTVTTTRRSVVTNRYTPTIRRTTTTTTPTTTTKAQAEQSDISASTWNYEFLGDTNPSMTTISTDLIDTVFPEKTGPLWSISPTIPTLVTAKNTNKSTTTAKPTFTSTTRRKPPFSRPSSFKPLPIVVLTTSPSDNTTSTSQPATKATTVPTTDDITWGYLTAGAFGEQDGFSRPSWVVAGSTNRPPTAGTFDNDETPAITANMIDAGVELISIKPEYSKKTTILSSITQSSTLPMRQTTKATPTLTSPAWSTVTVKDEENTIADATKPTSKPTAVINFINYSYVASTTPTAVTMTSSTLPTTTTTTTTRVTTTTRRRPILTHGPTGPSPGAPVGPPSSLLSKPVSVSIAWQNPTVHAGHNKPPSLAMPGDYMISTPSTVFGSSSRPKPLVFSVISTIGSTRRPPSPTFSGTVSPFVPTLANRRPSTSLLEGSHASTVPITASTPKTKPASVIMSSIETSVASTSLQKTPTPNHPETSPVTLPSTTVNDTTSSSTMPSPPANAISSTTVLSLTNGTSLLPAISGDRIDGNVIAYDADSATTTTTTSTTSSTPTTPRRNWDYRLHCGVRTIPKDEQRTGRIVGGKKTNFGDWPWQVLVRESTWLGLFTKNKCGGVLLNAKYVVTAAHCQPGFLASLTVSLGEYDLRGHLEPMRTVERNVKRVVVHRDYEPKTFENDIALLEMDKPVDFRPHIVPICLPEGNEDYVGQEGIVSGWGRIKYGGSVPSVLMQVTVPVMPNPSCQKMFEKAGHPKKIRDSFLCAGFEDGQHDSCEGDSGGPLMKQTDDGRWVLIGTVSHGIKCAWPNLPGIYMKMTYYKPWIMNIINS